jgi:hypothetical protein
MKRGSNLLSKSSVCGRLNLSDLLVGGIDEKCDFFFFFFLIKDGDRQVFKKMRGKAETWKMDEGDAI